MRPPCARLMKMAMSWDIEVTNRILSVLRLRVERHGTGVGRATCRRVAEPRRKPRLLDQSLVTSCPPVGGPPRSPAEAGHYRILCVPAALRREARHRCSACHISRGPAEAGHYRMLCVSAALRRETRHRCSACHCRRISPRSPAEAGPYRVLCVSAALRRETRHRCWACHFSRGPAEAGHYRILCGSAALRRETRHRCSA
jgi:hypothetical protein